MELSIKKEYLIFDLSKLNTKDSRPYLKMILSDSGGGLTNAIMFDCNKLLFDPKRGDLVSVTATIQQYNNQSQLKVQSMDLLAEGDADSFLPKSKKDPVKMAQDLEATLSKHIKNEYLTALVNAFFADKDCWTIFQRIPAAKQVHHAYIHGLLEHTLSVVDLGILVSNHYPQLDKDLLLVGALFHDVGKVKELETKGGFEYTDDGRLLGHLLLGMDIVNGYIANIPEFPHQLRTLVNHLLASHHGQLEFGSPQVPKTVEALMLNFIDDMDAKLNNYESVLAREEVLPGGWSNYDRLLERQIYKPNKN